MTPPLLVSWDEPGRTLLQRAAAWHQWMPAWIPSRVALHIRRTALLQYRQAVVCHLGSGVKFVADPSDLLQCLVGTTGGWEDGLMTAIRPLVRQGDVVLDIGAHVGYSALLFAQWVGETGRVYAFEPVPAHRDQLIRNFEVNGFAPRLAVIPAAVSDRDGSQPFYDSHRSNTGMSSLTGRRGAAATRNVATRAIDPWLASTNLSDVALAKIDVEGAEMLVLQGMAKTLAAGRIRALLIELHPDVTPGARSQIRALFAGLPVGYALFEWHPDDGFRAEPLNQEVHYCLAVRQDWTSHVLK